MEQLISIMDSYRKWNTQEEAEDCDMAVDEIPIPVASTPAVRLI